MARGRMIDRAFTTSTKLNKCSRDTRLAYASILPYLDREGRIQAEPLVLKANVFIRSDFTLEEIATAVRELADVGLIDLYANDDNAAILQYVKFGDLNKPNKNEASSKLPGPDDEGVVGVWDEALKATKRTGLDTNESDAHAMHVQITEVAPLERKREEERELTPPTPPTEPEAVTPGEEGDDLSPYQTAQLRKDRTNHHLPTFFKSAFDALVEFRRAHAKPISDGQFNAWADAVEGDCRDHGVDTVAEALKATTLILAELDRPFLYYRSRLRRKDAPDAGASTWQVDDFAQRDDDNRVEQIDQLLADGQARMSNGETWNLRECRRCNN